MKSILTVATVFAVAIGLVLGIFAGRHNVPPVPTVIAVKAAVERAVAPSFHWRRPFFEDTGGLRSIPCPKDAFVIVTGGQSNAANHLSDPVDASPDLPAYMFFRSRCYPLQDPVLGATGNRGSLWTRLGLRLAAETRRSVVFINGGVTSTAFRDWTIHPTGYFERLHATVKDAAAAGLRPNLVIWHQGESDAHRAADTATFAAELDDLLHRVRRDLVPDPRRPILLFKTSVCAGNRLNPNTALREAQRRAAETHEGVLIAMDTDTLGKRDRYDDCHFNARGREAIVDHLTGQIAPLIRDIGAPT